MKAKELLGKEVLDANAKRLGKVTDFEIDVSKGIVQYIDVKAGLRKGYVIGLDKIQVVGDRIILKVKEEEL